MSTVLRCAARRLSVLLLLLAGVVPVLGPGPAYATSAPGAAPVTYRDFGFSSASAPTADKPQSKLWRADGAWWALMLSPTDNAVHIFELRADHTWRDTGTVVDDRYNSTGDALWDGTRLYVASRTGNGTLRVVRVSYAPATRSWSVDAGFPVVVASGGMESTTIAKDSTGTLWVTYTQGSRPYVAHTTGSDTTWEAPYVVPTADTNLSADDISAVIAFGGKVGVMWSNQNTGTVDFAVHADGAPDGAWTLERPLSGPGLADDHVNLKTVAASTDGRVYAVTKTSQGDNGEGAGAPLIEVLSRGGDGSWTAATAGTVGDKLTRPQLLLDQTNQTLYVFATAPDTGGVVYYKSSPMADVRFSPGRGTPFLSWPGAKINNVSTTKDPVGPDTGIVAIAADSGTRTYYHAEMALPGSQPPPPPPPASGSSPTFVAASSGANTVSTSVSVALPAGVQAGDALVADVAARGSPTITAPAGWSLVRQDTASTTQRVAVFVKFASSSEAATVTFGLSKAQAAAGVVLAYRGVAAASPVDVATGQVNGASRSITAAGASTTAANDVLVGFFTVAVATTVSPPTEMTERTEVAATSGRYRVTVETADEVWPGPGETGPRTATAAATGANVGQLLALRPTG